MLEQSETISLECHWGIMLVRVTGQPGLMESRLLVAID